MNVIILAAGKGERLRPITDHIPKSLIEVRPGLPVLELQLQAIHATRLIDQVVLVSGYRAEMIEDYLRRVGDHRTKTIFNPFFESTNNLVSLWFAREWMTDDFIVLNGDNVFRPSLLGALVRDPSPATMMVDCKETYDEDDMKVITEGELVRAVSKTIEPSAADAESVGLIRFQGDAAATFRGVVDRAVRDQSRHRAFWLSAVQDFVDAGNPLRVQKCLASDWFELDVHSDVETAERRVDALARFIDAMAESVVMSGSRPSEQQ